MDIYKRGAFIFLSALLGFIVGGIFVYQFLQPVDLPSPNVEQRSHEDKVVRTISNASPSVVSIVVTKDIPVLEKYYYPFGGFRIEGYRQKGTEERQVGGGTGFVASDGLILTNKHVVKDKNARYSVLTNQGKGLEAEVLARDPVQDIAVLKVGGDLPVLDLGTTDDIRIGQSVIAIGNVLGEFRNSASTGIVSGLKRDITASGEQLDNIIQTDAAINKGNSGGPLLNLEGEVIGINTAIAVGAENVGFAIPIDRAKRDIEQVRETGEISYPFLGIYYRATEEGLEVTGVFDNSPAQEAGIEKGDVVAKFGGQKLNVSNTLADVLWGFVPGDEVGLEVIRTSERIDLMVTLEVLE